jgi:hypothetical protein
VAACPFCRSNVADDALTCPSCNSSLSRPCPLCGEQISTLTRTCRFCGALMKAADQGAAPAAALPPIPPAGPVGTDWESEGVNIFARWWRTFVRSGTRPDDFFREMDPNGSVWKSFTFVWFGLSLVAIPLGCCIAALFSLVLMPMMAERQGTDGPPPALGGGVAIGVGVMYAVLAPPLGALSTLLKGCFMHLFARMLGARGGLTATIRAVMFVMLPMAVALLINLIPYVGGCVGPLVQLVWETFILGKAFQTLHGLTPGRAYAAAIIPWAVCIGLSVLVGIIVAMATIGGLEGLPLGIR